MVFNSIDFLFFFPLVALMYYLIPSKIKTLWLLLTSYYFYMCWNPKYILLLFSSTAVTYLCGIIMDYLNQKTPNIPKTIFYKRITLIFALFYNLSFLIFYKYLDFLFINLNRILPIDLDSSITATLTLPVGISFYTFQSLGYVIDLYRKEIKAEKNFINYALFVSFFPVILSGPIERAKSLLKQINEAKAFNVENIRTGLLSFAWGLFLKLVVADRLAVFINPMFNDYTQYHGMSLLFALILYGFQIYFDFWSYSQMAVGCGLILGYHLNPNFDSPYFALSVSEFWRRWHISLTSWFRDYLYISLGGNRKGKLRKYINTMIIFLTSGLWHGAGWKFIIWGGLNGFYIVFQDLTKNLRNKFYRITHININSCFFIWVSRLFTFIFIDFAWLFFRANSLGDALNITKSIINDFRFITLFSETFWNTFLSTYNFIILFIPLMIAFWIDYLNYKKINVAEKILNQQLFVRWIIYFSIIISILFLGVYGEANAQTQFIYFQF